MEVTPLPRQQEDEADAIPSTQKRQEHSPTFHAPSHSRTGPQGPEQPTGEKALRLPEDHGQSLRGAEGVRRTGRLVSPWSQAALNKPHKPDVFQRGLVKLALQEAAAVWGGLAGAQRGSEPCPCSPGATSPPRNASKETTVNYDQDEFKEITVCLRTLGCFLTR